MPFCSTALTAASFTSSSLTSLPASSSVSSFIASLIFSYLLWVARGLRPGRPAANYPDGTVKAFGTVLIAFLFFLALVSGVYGVFLVRDLFFFYFAYELAVVPMYLLIGVWGSTSATASTTPVAPTMAIANAPVPPPPEISTVGVEV